mgnify:CR=1 FL=1
MRLPSLYFTVLRLLLLLLLLGCFIRSAYGLTTTEWLAEALAANGQNPEVLFITCSDSRIDPNLVTQTDPGELFICRNAGNIVPPHSNQTGGMTASIEFAVAALGVVCGGQSCPESRHLISLCARGDALNRWSVQDVRCAREWIRTL